MIPIWCSSQFNFLIFLCRTQWSSQNYWKLDFYCTTWGIQKCDVHMDSMYSAYRVFYFRRSCLVKTDNIIIINDFLHVIGVYFSNFEIWLKFILYNNCRKPRTLIGKFSISISGQTHEFVIYAILNATKENGEFENNQTPICHFSASRKSCLVDPQQLWQCYEETHHQ